MNRVAYEEIELKSKKKKKFFMFVCLKNKLNSSLKV